MSTFVLVHGAWHGSWCWKRVRKSLQALGHEVFTPSLTGLADRSHLLSPQVDLEMHITDVANLIRWEELSDVVLCGHSYGGCVVTGVADRIPDRIGALVYLDALVPENSESLSDLLPIEFRNSILESACQLGEGWKAPPLPAEAFDINAKDAEWVRGQLTMQPMAALQQPISLTGRIAQIKNVTYIRAGGWTMSPMQPFFEKATANGWRTLTMACGHDVMLDLPEEVTRELVNVSSRGVAAMD